MLIVHLTVQGGLSACRTSSTRRSASVIKMVREVFKRLTYNVTVRICVIFCDLSKYYKILMVIIIYSSNLYSAWFLDNNTSTCYNFVESHISMLYS